MSNPTIGPEGHPHSGRPLVDKAKKPLPELREKLQGTHLYDVKVEAAHLKHGLGKFANVFNPNHRHDEEHEQATDRKRTEVAKSHRFESFAPVRDGNNVKWYVDGRDYFWAVSVALDEAKETIYIADWWLSPELYLRRPPSSNRQWRLDEVLKRKAEAGVQIFIIVYKEVSQALSINSEHTKEHFDNLCPKGSAGHDNIFFMRHPDHNVFEHAGDMTFYWAHHEKLIVIDYALAFVGGLDLCFGRWDVSQHPLSDLHPSGKDQELFPGQDFNNNRIQDFHSIDNWEHNDVAKDEYGRMPWHDVHIGFRGPCVYDIAEHFVLRWNFCKRDKGKRKKQYPWLELVGREGDDEDLVGVQHPKHPVGGYVKHPLDNQAVDQLQRHQGTVTAQVVRSSCDWSSGILNEHSIETAYIDIIRNAQHYVYIENQFFITSTGEEQLPMRNQIGRAIVDACVRAGKEGRKFRVIIVMPAIPGFAGDLRDDAAAGTRAIMDYQYKSILRGEHSIMARIRAQGVEPNDHIFVFNLRSFDRLNTEGVAKKSDKPDDTKEDDSRKKNETSSSTDDPLYVDSIADAAMLGGTDVSKAPMTYGEGINLQELDEYIQEELYIHAKLCIVDDRVVICGSSNINDRSQLGYHDSEVSIVLEDTATVKSTMDGKPYEAGRLAATLRRRLWREHLGLWPAQLVDASHDPAAQPPREQADAGELDKNETTNQGKEPEEIKKTEESEKTTEREAGDEGDPEKTTEKDDGDGGEVQTENDEDIDKEDAFVADPLNDKLWKTWTESADVNTEVFRSVFHADPDNFIRTFKDYDRFLPRGGTNERKRGRIFDPFRPAGEVHRQLDRIRGHLVWMPLDFLCEAEMAEKGLAVNSLTESIYT